MTANNKKKDLFNNMHYTTSPMNYSKTNNRYHTSTYEDDIAFANDTITSAKVDKYKANKLSITPKNKSRTLRNRPTSPVRYDQKFNYDFTKKSVSPHNTMDNVMTAKIPKSTEKMFVKSPPNYLNNQLSTKTSSENIANIDKYSTKQKNKNLSNKMYTSNIVKNYDYQRTSNKNRSLSPIREKFDLELTTKKNEISNHKKSSASVEISKVRKTHKNLYDKYIEKYKSSKSYPKTPKKNNTKRLPFQKQGQSGFQSEYSPGIYKEDVKQLHTEVKDLLQNYSDQCNSEVKKRFQSPKEKVSDIIENSKKKYKETNADL